MTQRGTQECHGGRQNPRSGEGGRADRLSEARVWPPGSPVWDLPPAQLRDGTGIQPPRGQPQLSLVTNPHTPDMPGWSCTRTEDTARCRPGLPRALPMALASSLGRLHPQEGPGPGRQGTVAGPFLKEVASL